MQMSRQQLEIVQLFEVKIVLCHWHRMTRWWSFRFLNA